MTYLFDYLLSSECELLSCPENPVPTHRQEKTCKHQLLIRKQKRFPWSEWLILFFVVRYAIHFFRSCYETLNLMEHNSLSSSDKAKCSKHQLLNFFTFTNSHCQVSWVNLVLFVTSINLFQLCDSFEYD